METIQDWDEFFIRIAYLIAQKSKDSSTKIGSVLVRDRSILSAGFNGLPIGCNDNIKERHLKPHKYHFYEHSERNCLYLAARHGTNTSNSTLFTLSPPCSDCGRGLIQSGVKELVFHKQHFDMFSIENPKWRESCDISFVMLQESGIKIKRLDKVLNIECLIAGQSFHV